MPHQHTAQYQGPNRARYHLLILRRKLSLFQRIPRDVWLPVVSILESSWCVRGSNLFAESWLGEGASGNVMVKWIARSRSGQTITPLKETCTGRLSLLCGAVRKRKYNRCGDTARGRIRSTDLNVKATTSSRGPKVPGWRAPVRRRFAGKPFGSGFCNNERAILSKPEIAEKVFSRNYESCNNSSGWLAHS